MPGIVPRRIPDDPYWDMECPARNGVILRHKAKDWPPQPDTECAECGVSPWEYRRREAAPLEAGVGPMSPVDVNARLRALGLMGPEESDEDIRTNTAVEPKMADPKNPRYGGGNGVRGRSWHGDGKLNPRDYGRLEAVLATERRRGYR